jgi:hypothetical protein
MKKLKQFTTILAIALFVIACDKDDYDDDDNPVVASTVLKVAGDSVTVAAKLDEFRIVLGNPLNVAPNQVGGRREVNWDGVPAANSNNNNFPVDFFNNIDPAAANGRKRGLLYAQLNGTFLRVDSTDFSEIDASYAGQFESFSRKRLISSLGTNITEFGFKIPGTNTDATVKGFGVIFSDVDDANSTYVEFFNDNKSLGVFKAPAAAGSAKFSFLGVSFQTEKITRVRITVGNGLLVPGNKDVTNGGGQDLVVMDDFLYNEPVIK